MLTRHCSHRLQPHHSSPIALNHLPTSSSWFSMSSQQQPLGTGFTAFSTASDVMAGIDLTGKTAIVTGGHSGLGLETTRALSQAGARVTVASRDPQRAAAAVAGLQGVEVSQLDLIDPHSVSSFTSRWLASQRPLHLLINNASPPSSAVLERDARGYEPHFATAHLGHFQLTCGLLPALQAAGGARVVNVSSGAQRMGDIRWEDPNFVDGYTPLQAYCQAKKANVLFSVELDRRWAADDIRGYAVHPGVIIHGKERSAATEERLRAMGLVDADGQPVIDPSVGKKSMAQGVATIVFAATSPLLQGIGGVYLKDCDVSPVDDRPRQLTAQVIPAEVVSSSIDSESARKLWELSERLLR